MDKLEILAAYNAEFTVLGMAVIFFGLIAYNRIMTHNISWIVELSCGLFLVFLSEFIRRGWWAVWKDGYNSFDAVSWMMNHPIVWATSLIMIGGVCLTIKSLSRSANGGRYWIATLFCGMFIYILTILKG